MEAVASVVEDTEEADTVAEDMEAVASVAEDTEEAEVDTVEVVMEVAVEDLVEVLAKHVETRAKNMHWTLR